MDCFRRLAAGICLLAECGAVLGTCPEEEESILFTRDVAFPKGCRGGIEFIILCFPQKKNSTHKKTQKTQNLHTTQHNT
jgi:hypothetical protein